MTYVARDSMASRRREWLWICCRPTTNPQQLEVMEFGLNNNCKFYHYCSCCCCCCCCCRCCCCCCCCETVPDWVLYPTLSLQQTFTVYRPETVYLSIQMTPISWFRLRTQVCAWLK